MGTTVLTPKNTHVEFDIPEEYVGKELTIVYSAKDENKPEEKKATMAEFWGILSKETGDDLQKEIKKMRNEWERDI